MIQVFMALPTGFDARAVSHYPGDFGICISRCINLTLPAGLGSMTSWCSPNSPTKATVLCEVKHFS